MLDLYEREFAALPESQILGTDVLMTIIGGDVVYAAPDAPSPAAVAQ
jgi:hypothetical protein